MGEALNRFKEKHPGLKGADLIFALLHELNSMKEMEKNGRKDQ